MHHNHLSQAARLFLTLLLFGNAAVQAGDEPSGPPNRNFTFNFQPMSVSNGSSSGIGVFAQCLSGYSGFGTGAKYDSDEPHSTMCHDNQGGPGDGERYVHDGYFIPGQPNSEYILEQDEENDIHHMVMIDEAQGFKMEIYIHTSSGTAGLTQAREMSGGENDHHVYPIDPKDPERTGTGSGDPNRVQYRMVVEDQGFKMEMQKYNWQQKPKITQTVSGAEMSLDTVIDMTNSNYSQMDIPAVITHTLDVANTDPFVFDSRDNNGEGITGGRFKISRYSDYPVDPHYQYVDAPDDYGKNLDWLSYWHGSQYWQPGDSYGFGSKD